jgi:hypothetical protein
MSHSHDLFISYRRKDAEQVDALVAALKNEGLTVWIDRAEIEDAASIQRRIDAGLSGARALLAWYSIDYPKSRACQWELTAALIASADEEAPVTRLLVVNPEGNAEHLQLIDVRNLQHFRADADLAQVARSIAAAVQPIVGGVGELRRLTKPQWHGRMHGLGSARFVGRVEELWKIHFSLAAGNFAIVAGRPAPRAAGELAQVRGSGGIGKSLLAEEYALRFGAWWPGGIFWLRALGVGDNPAETEAELAARREVAYGSQLAGIALELGLDTRDQSDAQLRAAIGRRLSEPYLWIVDDLPRCDREELERWLAPSVSGQTLVTTRNKRQDALGQAIDLDVLGPEDARELLTRDHPTRVDEAEAVAAILGYLDGYALALDVARAACRDLGYAAYRRYLENPDADALALAAELAPELPNGHNPQIAATLLASLRQLDAAGVDALRLAVHGAVAPIPANLLAATLAEADGLDEDEAIRHAALGLRQALDSSLADDAGTRQYGVHNLVLHTLRRHDPDPARQAALAAPLTRVLRTAFAARAADIRQHADLTPLVVHAQARANQAADAETLELAGWLGRYEYQSGRYRAAEGWYEQQRQGQVANLGEEHPDTLTSLNNLAGTLRAQGDLAGARALQEKVLEARRRVLGEEHPDTLTSMGNLASTLRAQGDLAGARALQEKVLEAHRRVLGEEHPDTLISLNNLASTLWNQGDLAGARALQEKELEICRRVLGEEHPDTLISLNNLASTLWNQGDLAGARALEEKVLEARRRLLGEEHPDTLTSMNNLAGTLWNQGDLAGARTLQEKVLEARRRVLGEAHPATLTSMNNLAGTLRAQGDLAGARALQEKVLEARRRVLGEEHPDVTGSAWNLFATLSGVGDTEAAGGVFERHLLSLIEQPAESLSADQRKIREMIMEKFSETRAGTGPAP